MANHLYLANRVKYLKNINFSQLTQAEKLSIKDIGRPTPNLVIEQEAKSRKSIYKRSFNSAVYCSNDWICGCEETNALFSFPCLLFSKEKSAWVTTGVNDLNHLSQKIDKHERSQEHKNRAVDYNLLGSRADIGYHMHSAYKQSIAKYNEQVAKNRDALSKIINII